MSGRDASPRFDAQGDRVGAPAPGRQRSEGARGLAPAVLALQRSHGNRAVTRALSRWPVMVSQKKMFEDEVAAKKWNRAAQVFGSLTADEMTAALSFLDINQLGYLDDGAHREGLKESDPTRVAIRKALVSKGVKKPAAATGRRYGKIKAKVGKIVHGDASKNKGYEFPMDITFMPTPGAVAAEEIAFVQTAKTVDTTTGVDPSPNHPNRNMPDYNHLDRVAGKKFGWYGYMDDESKSGNVKPWKKSAPKKPAWMWDGPSWDTPNMTWTYETAAVCRKGSPDTADRKGDKPGFVYAFVTWGFTVDAKLKVKALPIQIYNKPTDDFKESVRLWNVQAAGPAAQRNAPGAAQDLLPDLE